MPEREPERLLPRPRTAAGAKIAHSLQEAVMRREGEYLAKKGRRIGGQVWCQQPR